MPSTIRPEKVVVSPQNSVTMMKLDWACDYSAIDTCAIGKEKVKKKKEKNDSVYM